MEKKNSLPRTVTIKDDVDEVDRCTPSQFDPNSTSTSIYDYEDDDQDDQYPGVEDFCSLPVQVAQLNDSIYLQTAMQTHHHWEAEDVGDFITTLDETSSSADEFAYAKPSARARPKSLYNPGGGDMSAWEKVMTTSCYGELTPENLNRLGSDPQLDVSAELEPSPLAQLDGNARQWMASTEELMNLEDMIQQRVVVDIHQQYPGDSLNTSVTEDNLASLENSYCEPQQQQLARASDLVERAKSGESRRRRRRDFN